MTISFSIILLRLGLALILGAVIGLERESTEHIAGLRTQALVALGSSLFTVISAFGFADLLGQPHIQLDPTRIASYIVAGIGFLGAGSIFMSRNKDEVRGLTTAASVWLVAAIGMACGAGLLLEAVAATILALFVLIVLRYVERLILPYRSPNMHILRIEATSPAGPFIADLYNTCAHYGLTIETLKVDTEQAIDTVEVVCRTPNPATLTHAIDELRALSGVRAIQANLSTPRKGNTLPKDSADKAS